MGTGVGIRQENSKNQKLTAPRLPDIDKAKVAKIVDVCNVSFDEACRVLEACHMDLDMAINRFLSGTETTTWSEVSKKKKTVVPPRNSSGQRHGRGRDHERERDRRERDRPSGNSSETHSGGYRGRQSRSNGHQAPREGNANGAQRSNDTDAPAASRTYHNAPKRTSEHADYRAAAAESGKASTVPPTMFESVAPAAHRPTPPEKDNAGAPVSTELNWKPPQRQVPLAHRLVWNLEQPKTDASSSVVASKVAEEKPPNALEIVTSDELPVTNVPSKRTFNYAAAAAAGTSHAKQPVLPTVQIKNATIAPATAPAPAPVVEQDSTQAEPAPRAENGDVKKRRNRGGRKHRARTDAQRAVQGSEATPSQRAVETLQEPTVDAAEAPVSSAQSPPRTDGAGAVETAELPPMPRTEPTNAWAARAAAKEAKEKKQAENAAAAAVVNPPVAPVVAAADNSAADSITLKFGSLGLGALNPVNWLAHEKAGPVQEKSVSSMSTPTASAPAVSRVPGVPATIPGIANPSVSVGTATTSTSEPTLPVTSTADGLAPPPRDPIAPSLMPTSTSLPVVSGAIGNGSGIFPVMPPLPQNYPAYNVGMMPGYSPYESGSDLNNSHNLNLLYDPSALPGMPTGATGGKYTSMPGLGDNSMLSGGPSISSSSKDMLGSGIGDGDKGNTSGTGVLPGAMDPLPAPGYMMPQYPYPMYGFPPYAQPGMQPGMGPPGPSHFGYPPAGQVTSQGGFGGYPGQSSNINKFNAGNAGRVGFGFDDGSSGLAGASGRNSAGLENMYGRGGYAPMSEHKGMDTSSYKNARSSVPSGLHGVAAGAGLSNPAPVASGMPYSEYSGGNSVHSGGLNVGNVGPGGWTNRQPGNGRSDGAIGNQAPGNNVLPGAAGNNGIYAPAPGAPGGYWTNSPYY